MNHHDEELNLENVDEVVARQLASLQTSQPSTSLDRAMRNLQTIYTEKRRVERVWKRLNEHVSTFGLPPSLESSAENEPGAFQPTPIPEITAQNGHAQEQEKLPIFPRKPASDKHSWSRRRWRNTGIGLVAALILITLFTTFFAWPVLVSHTSLLSGPPSPVATVSPLPPSATREYTGRYFTFRYPATWTISEITSESAASALQIVRIRPSVTSADEITISILARSTLSIDQLLSSDPDTQQGKLEGIHTESYHLLWRVGAINLTPVSAAQAQKLEIAYARKTNPYRIELSATPDAFERSLTTFNMVLASFTAQSQSTSTTPVSGPTPTTTSSSTTATPLPTAKVYSSKYFTLQYPVNWVITSDVIGGTSRQVVKFHPSATSTVVITVIALYPSTLPASQLLTTDPDVALGVLQNTSTVTSHGISWSEGIVNRAGALLVQPDKLEIAYSNQNAPYKIELSAPPGTFDAYSPVFDGIVASFYSKTSQ